MGSAAFPHLWVRSNMSAARSGRGSTRALLLPYKTLPLWDAATALFYMPGGSSVSPPNAQRLPLYHSCASLCFRLVLWLRAGRGPGCCGAAKRAPLIVARGAGGLVTTVLRAW
jgi:hypothetical protein